MFIVNSERIGIKLSPSEGMEMEEPEEVRASCFFKSGKIMN